MATIASIPTIVAEFAAGNTWVAAVNVVDFAAMPILLFALYLPPRRFTLIVTTMFVVVYLSVPFEVAAVSGLLPGSIAPVFALIIAIGALIAFGIRAEASEFSANRLLAPPVASWVCCYATIWMVLLSVPNTSASTLAVTAARAALGVGTRFPDDESDVGSSAFGIQGAA